MLETHGNQNHNAWALLDMRKHPARYRREYTTDRGGAAVPVPDGDEARPDARGSLRAAGRPSAVEDAYGRLRRGDPIADS